MERSEEKRDKRENMEKEGKLNRVNEMNRGKMLERKIVTMDGTEQEEEQN